MSPIFVDLSLDAQRSLIAGARDRTPVRGLTHGFYKYPARFSPAFARAAIKAFTDPGDLCLDPHVGGGTTLVEAIAAGRHAIGIDVSPLAEFVATVKSIVLTEAEIGQLEKWLNRLPSTIDMQRRSSTFSDYAELGYYKHLNHPLRWRLRKAIEQGVASAGRLEDPKLEAFGRCVLLRAAQWALDGRAKQTTIREFRNFVSAVGKEMLEGARQLCAAVTSHKRYRPSALVINRNAIGIENDRRISKSPRLILTSPPYPGVHVLYHRWQVDGRKETPLPFMIAGKLDGAGGSYYTMGDRKCPELKTYFDNIRAVMLSLAAVANEHTTVVQMVAFSDREWQLQRYLEAMEDAGLQEVFLEALVREGDGRLWRAVPGRRWYSDQRGDTPGSQEVVLIHRKVRAVTNRLRARPPLEASWVESGRAGR